MKRTKQLIYRARHIWTCIMVASGYGLRCNTTGLSQCVFHGVRMKRQGKTEVGAFYYKCARSYHLRSKGNRLVPV